MHTTLEPPAAHMGGEHWLRPVLSSLVPADALEQLSARRGEELWAAAVRTGLVDDARLLHAAAEHLKLPVAELQRASPQAMELVGERWARRFHVLPLQVHEREIVVATCNPFDIECERMLAFASGRAVRFALASPVGLAERIESACRGELARGAMQDAAFTTADVQHLGRDSEGVPQADAEHARASIVRLVDQLLAEAITTRASDLHLEAEERGVAVRHRIDGVLRLVRLLPRSIAPAMVSRIKILSGLDIADRLRPQDGRARIAVNGQAVDLRVSTLPASHGEKVVVRVLDGQATSLSLEAMGFLPDEHERIDRLMQAREGLILVTGPTGSGKTTTLYAALRRVQERAVNIVTVEDPVEYRLAGVVQVQIHERAGLSFGKALRSIMRQDPDVILVGEIRDRETAEIAIQASLTGHLVFSTLHTNDAASAVTRLLDMGVAPHKIAAAVKGVLAQRLVRRLCTRCRAPSPPTPAEAERLGGDVPLLQRAGGCDECAGTGYRGRLAIAEVLVAGGEVEQCISAGEGADRIARAARAAGMRTLWQSGVAHVSAGDTTLEELERVAEPPGVATESRVVREQAPTAHAQRVSPLAQRPPYRVRVECPEPHRSELSRLLEEAGEEAVGSASPCDAAIIQAGALPALIGALTIAAEGAHAAMPLVVALRDPAVDDGAISILAAGADAVLDAPVRPALILATLLALRRCRERGTPER